MIVPVLSKQQTTTLPAGEVRKGSVQKIEYFRNATKLTLSAKLSSIGGSGGGAGTHDGNQGGVCSPPPRDHA